MFAEQKSNKRWLPKIFETIISCEKCRLVLFKHQQETQHKEKALGGYCDRCQNWVLLLSRFCPSLGVMSRQAGAALLVTAETFRCFNWTFVSIWPRGKSKSFTGARQGQCFLIYLSIRDARDPSDFMIMEKAPIIRESLCRVTLKRQRTSHLS